MHSAAFIKQTPEGLEEMLRLRRLAHIHCPGQQAVSVKVSSVQRSRQKKRHSQRMQEMHNRGDPFAVEINVENCGVWLTPFDAL